MSNLSLPSWRPQLCTHEKCYLFPSPVSRLNKLQLYSVATSLIYPTANLVQPQIQHGRPYASLKQEVPGPIVAGQSQTWSKWCINTFEKYYTPAIQNHHPNQLHLACMTLNWLMSVCISKIYNRYSVMAGLDGA